MNPFWKLGTKIKFSSIPLRRLTCPPCLFCKCSHALVVGDLRKFKISWSEMVQHTFNFFISQLCQTLWSGRSHFPFAEKKPFFRLPLFWHLQPVHLLERTSAAVWNSGCTSSLILTPSPNCWSHLKEWVGLCCKDTTWLLLLTVQLESVKLWALYSFVVSRLRNAFSYLVRFPDKRSLARDRSCVSRSSPSSSNFAMHFHYMRSIKSDVGVAVKHAVRL